MPQFLGVRGTDGADAQQEQRDDDDPPGTPAIGEAAYHRTGGAQQEQRDGRGTGQGTPAPAELGFHRFDVDTEDRSDAGGREHTDGHGTQHDPRRVRADELTRLGYRPLGAGIHR